MLKRSCFVSPCSLYGSPRAFPNDRAGMPLLPAQAEKQREKAQHYKQVRVCGDDGCSCLGTNSRHGRTGGLCNLHRTGSYLFGFAHSHPEEDAAVLFSHGGAAPSALGASRSWVLTSSAEAPLRFCVMQEAERAAQELISLRAEAEAARKAAATADTRVAELAAKLSGWESKGKELDAKVKVRRRGAGGGGGLGSGGQKRKAWETLQCRRMSKGEEAVC